MSTIATNNITSTTGTTISVPTGKKIAGTDTGSIYAPGMVIQTVVSEFTTGNVNPSANQTWTTVGPNVTIAPKFSNSRVLLTHSCAGLMAQTNYIGVRFLRGSTDIGTHWGWTDNTNFIPVNLDMINYDNPATTSSITYYVQTYATQNYTQFHYNYYGSGDGGTRQCLLMAQEIAQ
tara:strand:+ start:1107 stop:1634 length:528 start_codon:yes stop_codon:yes gene_type:complete